MTIDTRSPYLVVMMLAGVVVAFVASGCAARRPMHVNVQPGGSALSMPDTISLSGRGEAQGTPDIAQVSLGVETRAPLPDQALRDANRSMEAMMKRLDKLGVARKDMRTSNFSVSMQRVHEPTPVVREDGQGKSAGRKTYTYEAYVSNTLTVTVRDLDKVGRVLAEVVEAGANHIHGIQFLKEDNESMKEEARVAAIKDAETKARSLAAAAGVKLGAVVMIQDGGGDEGGPMPMYRKSMVSEAMSDVPVERGQLTVHHSVNVVYQLVP